MLELSPQQATYRILRHRCDGTARKHYRATVEVIDEHSQQPMAVCDLIGKAMFTTLEINDQNQQIWQVRPNRKIMPSLWTVTDPQQRIAIIIDQRLLFKFITPFHRTELVLRNNKGKVLYHLDDPQGLFSRIFGSGPLEWHLKKGKEIAAKMGYIRKKQPNEANKKGLFAKLTKWMASSDPGFVSAGADHLLPAPVVLAMQLLHEEIASPL